MKKIIFNSNFIKIIILCALFFLPWINGNYSDEIKPSLISQEDMTLYEVNPCKVSLIEFLINDPKSVFQDHYHFRFNNYSSINCFGKISGATLLNNEFYISVGTSSLVNLFLQIAIWSILISFVKEDEKLFLKRKYFTLISSITSLFFILLIKSEFRYYEQNIYLFDLENLKFNIFLFLILGFSFFNLIEVILSRASNLINYFPFIYLTSGVLSGFNFGIYNLIFFSIGIIGLFRNKKLIYFNFTYILFGIFWLINSNNRYSFEPDKLRGFTSTSYESGVNVLYIIFFLIFFNGLIYYLSKNIQNLNPTLFTRNMLLSAGITLFFGLLSSNLPIVNFFSYYFFGLGKYGISIENPFSYDEFGLKVAWRGLFPSAETIGEFYALVLIFCLFIYYKLNYKFKAFEVCLIIFSIFGLFFSNNRAAFFILLFSFIVFIKNYLFKSKKLLFSTVITFLALIVLIIGLQNFSYPYSFTSNYLIELSNNFSSDGNLSSSLNYLNILSKQQGVLFHLFSIFGFVSFFLNRSQLWAYFFAKYNPSFEEFLFGTGPINFAKNYGDIQIDINSLLLPHSTLLSYLLFFGSMGLGLLILYFLNKIYLSRKKINNLGFLILIFLFTNLLKSDSMLYINSFIFYILLIFIALDSKKLSRK